MFVGLYFKHVMKKYYLLIVVLIVLIHLFLECGTNLSSSPALPDPHSCQNVSGVKQDLVALVAL